MPTYEGWKNWETWSVALWIDNEEPLYRHWREVARDYLDHPENPETWNVLGLSERLSDEFWADAEEARYPNPILKQFAETSLDAVDWKEIAEHLLQDVDED